jgi:hypothetical protein
MDYLITNTQGHLDTEQLRQAYRHAVKDAQIAEKLSQKLTPELCRQSPLALAYSGALDTLKARHCWNPMEKLYLAQRSQQQLARAVALASHNVEIRFLRYSIQLGLPAYLNLSINLQEDKKLIIDLIGSDESLAIGSEHLRAMIDFMQNEGRCSSAEKAILKQVAAALD